MRYKFNRTGNLRPGIYESNEHDESTFYNDFLLSKRRKSLYSNFNLLILERLKKIAKDPYFIIFFGSFVTRHESPKDIDISVFLSDNDLKRLKKIEDIFYAISTPDEKYLVQIDEVMSYEVKNFQEIFDSAKDELWCVDKLSGKEKGVIQIWFNKTKA